MESDAASAVSAVWRLEAARLVAGLTRMTNDVRLAEDLAQDALVAAPSALTPGWPCSTRNERERTVLLGRADEISRRPGSKSVRPVRRTGETDPTGRQP